MGKLLIPVLIVLSASAAAILSGSITRSRLAELINHFKHIGITFCSQLSEMVDRVDHIVFKDLIDQFGLSKLFSHFKSRISREPVFCRSQESYRQLDMGILNCRVKLVELKDDNCVLDAFSVEVCGTIHAPVDMHNTALRISIFDVTEGLLKAKPLQTRVKQWSASSGPESVFCYKAELGRLPHQVTTLSDWTAIAQLRLDWLLFPRKGGCDLQFNTSILSAEDGEELAFARCFFTYENSAFGYIELQQNIERTKTLAVALAFAVSAADDKLYDCEIEIIKNWTRDNILENSERTSDNARRKLDKALDKTIAFFREGNKLDTYNLCREIAEIAPIGHRYDILDLCLYVAQAKGSVAAEELVMLKNLANWLDVDAGRFRIMMEKILPMDMHEVKDVEAILGITSDMSKEKARQHLNKEYSKWNSRVTNSDPEIQTQADQMLKLIAEARGQYVAENPILQKDTKILIR